MQMTEDNLLMMLNSFKGNEYKIILYTSKKRVEIVDMPLLVAEIKQIGEAIRKIAQWTEPAPRRPIVPQPVIHAERRHSPPRRNELAPRDNSSKKLKQRFDFQFKSLIRIIDGQAEMDSETRRSQCIRRLKT